MFLYDLMNLSKIFYILVNKYSLTHHVSSMIKDIDSSVVRENNLLHFIWLKIKNRLFTHIWPTSSSRSFTYMASRAIRPEER